MVCKKKPQVKDRTKAFFTRSSALFPMFSCLVSGSCWPSSPGLHPPWSKEPFQPMRQRTCFLLLIHFPPALQHCRVEDVTSLILCHRISQDESFVPSTGLDLFFLVWFLLSLPLTVLDLGFFQRKRWGVEDRESVYSVLSQTLQCDYSPMFL